MAGQPSCAARLAAALVVASLALHCQRNRETAPTAWPRWPSGAAEIRALASRETLRREARGYRDRSAGEILASLRKHLAAGGVVGGWPAIIQWIRVRADAASAAGRNFFALWGTFHDARLQVDGFRRLMGPLGIENLTAVVVEQFQADGRWRGVEPSVQRGESEILGAFLATGRREELERLRASQVRENYTAWKYGYLDSMLDLVVTARSTGNRLLACDMPTSLQERLGPDVHDELTKLREIHCMLGLRDSLADRGAPHRVVMLWGQGHVAPAGIPALLPPEDVVVSFYVFGGRASRHGLERRLAESLGITDPLLVPLGDGDREFAVLLPDAHLGARMERKHRPPDRQFLPVPGQLLVSAARPATIDIRGRRTSIGPEPVVIPAPTGHTCFLVEGEPRALAGCFSLLADGATELWVDADHGEVEVTVHRPNR